MTENEAIERIKTGICCEKGTARYCTDACMYVKEKCAYSVAIKALKEIQQYRELEKRLTGMFGGELSLETVVDELERQLKEPDNPHPINAKILTYEDAAAWDAYRAIGTPEECRAAMEKQTETLTVDKAKTIAAKAICIGCGYLADCKCDYNGGNCMVSKPMLESVLKSFDDWNRRANDGKTD